MTEQNKKLETKETDKKVETKNVEKKPKGNGVAIFFSFFLFLVTSGVLAFAYYWYQPKMNQLTSNIRQLEDQLNTIKQNNKQAYLATQIKQLNAKFNQLDSSTQQTVKKIDSTIKKINQQVFINKQDWLYADIHYLLKLAIRRVDLVGDSKGAIAALEAADSQIKKVENSALLDIRKTIFNTIKKLQAANEPDTEQLILKINHIKNLLVTANMPQNTNIADATSNIASTQSNTVAKDSKQSIYQFFSQFFTIKNETEQQQPTQLNKINPTAQVGKQSFELILFIEKIKQAILTMNQEKFDFYIRKLNQAISGQDFNVSIKNEIEQLRNQQVGIALPSASLPLKRYERYLEKRQEESQGTFK